MAYMFTYEGSDFVLDFDRKSVATAERMLNVNIEEVQSFSYSGCLTLFHAALLKHQPKIKLATVERLYELQNDKIGLHQDLLEMYAETINSLMEDKPEGEGLTRMKI